MPYQNISAELTAADLQEIKAAAKKTPGLKAIAEQLGERFKATRAKAAKEESVPASVS